MRKLFTMKIVLSILFAVALSGQCQAQERSTPRFKAIAFDYFVIF